MLTSQVLETGIGIAFLLVVLSTAASALLDLARRLLNSRSKDLEAALKSFFAPDSGNPDGGTLGQSLRHLFQTVRAPNLVGAASDSWDAFRQTSVYQGAVAARGQVRPAYLSAKSFAEAVEEQVRDGGLLTGPLQKRVQALQASVEEDTLAIRAGLERWFDETMAGLSSRYSKRSAVWLFVIGFVFAVVINASVPHVAHELWHNSATRSAVVAASEGLGQPTTATEGLTPAETINQIATATDEMSQLGIPIGWREGDPGDAGWWLSHIFGWILTAVLISLGAAFWFDLLGRLTAMRSPKPAPATDDETSASSAVRSRSVEARPVAWPDSAPGPAGPP